MKKSKVMLQHLPENFSFTKESEWKKLTPSELLFDFGGVVLEEKDDVFVIAAENPDSSELKQYLKQKFPNHSEVMKMSEKQRFSALRSGVVDLKEEIKALVVSDLDEDARIPRLVTLLVHFAIQEGASDIHIESRRYDSIVRFRLDGVLREVVALPADTHTPVVARIKILSNMRTDETRRPQDGRFEPEGCTDISLRVSVMPTLYGEKVVMRILNEAQHILELEQLGFSEEQQKTIKRNMEKPYGMIIASGPTGSGKTTTLYSFMRLLNASDINIATLEDPIESSIEGVNQTQVNPELSFSFATGLRTLLRQDPDAILVGEIRDEDTVNMAAHASMTGHLVMTSLHTNDASSAFTRFTEMGVDTFLTASVVNLVVAQRLVRGVCPHCSKKAKLDKVIVEKVKERKDICEAIKNVNPEALKNIEEETFNRAVGCEKCLQSGYTGRMGVFELLEMNKEVHDLILKNTPADEIQKHAEKNGMQSMVQDGVKKIFEGKTTFEEILRVTRAS